MMVSHLAWEWRYGDETIVARVDAEGSESVYVGKRLVSRGAPGSRLNGHPLGLARPGGIPATSHDPFRTIPAPTAFVFLDARGCDARLVVDGLLVPPSGAPGPMTLLVARIRRARETRWVALAAALCILGCLVVRAPAVLEHFRNKALPLDVSFQPVGALFTMHYPSSCIRREQRDPDNRVVLACEGSVVGISAEPRGGAPFQLTVNWLAALEEEMGSPRRQDLFDLSENLLTEERSVPCMFGGTERHAVARTDGGNAVVRECSFSQNARRYLVAVAVPEALAFRELELMDRIVAATEIAGPDPTPAELAAEALAEERAQRAAEQDAARKAAADAARLRRQGDPWRMLDQRGVAPVRVVYPRGGGAGRVLGGPGSR